MKIKLSAAALGLAGFLAAAYSLVPVVAYAQTPIEMIKTSQTKKSAAVKVADADQSKPSKPAVVAEVDTIVVQPGDTLSSIAVAEKTTYVRLFDANLFIENPDVINPGDVVRIPKPDEQLAARELPTAHVATPPQQIVMSAPKVTVVPAVAGAGVWDQLAKCESGGNWAINTGNGFYGGLQFTLSTWAGVGGSGYPNQASREEQIARAQILQARSGWGQWPACTAKLGLR